MSGASTATWLLGAAAAAGTAATIDANKAASHQARLQGELQKQQIADATATAEKDRAMTERLAQEQLAAQEAMQEASLAAAEKQAAESRALMDKSLKAADENMNRATQKRPNTAGILASAQQAGKAGASGTMLTGPQGVDPAALTLGRSTLLGA
jgi:hypothetical protein